ncbi:hypothetical protein FJY68_09205 [candidate division WOR-3 bacterium]|uniref:PorV/PorQ family protein n=1 Tax=candidate division WOR-3 bacterium TaxID=2052148 RepID=A0A938BTL7_UNCW3|nr:hypothetical protein [candidate division WOR-3 bacterium]
MVLLVLLCAFEFPGYFGRSAAMVAGAAVADNHHSFFLNPALGLDERQWRVGICCSRPYGLPGLAWGRFGGSWSSGRLAAGLGLSSLVLGRYGEHDAGLVLGGTPTTDVAVGLGVHALVVSAGPEHGDFVPSFDAGVCWRSGRVRLGAAALRLNSPRWREGTELPLRFVVAGSWSPVDDLLLALDLSRERGDEDAAFGAEFLPVPQIALRLGIGVAPLRYAAGLGAEVGPLRLEYAYQFRSGLKETHVLGLRAAWH